MIEVTALEEICYYETLQLFSDILHWITSEILKDSEHVLYIHGAFIIFNEESKVASLLILPDTHSEKRILQMLFQPPGEFQGKYIAKIPSKEPELVVPPTTSQDATEETVLKDDDAPP